MKIALLTNNLYPYGMGGMQKHSYYLVRFLAQKGVNVDVYFFKSRKVKWNSSREYFSNDELKNIKFNELQFPKSTYFPGHYIYNSYRYSKRIYQKLINQLSDVDFIYVQGFSGLKLLKEKRNIESLPPIGVNFHGLEMFQQTADIRSRFEQYLFRPVTRFCLKRADIAFSLGGKLTHILKREVGEATDIVEVPIGIEEKWIIKNVKPTSGTRKFIFIGRYERRKGIQELNEAIQKIDGKYDFSFEFIGPIPEQNRLQLSSCFYHGPIYDEDKIISLISDGDILVCPSYSEGMPTVILEAMSRGLAVIATDVGGVKELVSSKTGWIIEAADIQQLKETLVKALQVSDSELAQKKVAARSLIAEKFTWQNVASLNLDCMRTHISEQSRIIHS